MASSSYRMNFGRLLNYITYLETLKVPSPVVEEEPPEEDPEDEEGGE